LGINYHFVPCYLLGRAPTGRAVRGARHLAPNAHAAAIYYPSIGTI